MSTDAVTPPVVKPPLPLWLVMGWPLIVGLAVLYIMDKRTEAKVGELIASRPSIAIIDELKFVEKYGNTEQGMQAAYVTAAKLREEGFVVLDRGTVLDAPASAEALP